MHPQPQLSHPGAPQLAPSPSHGRSATKRCRDQHLEEALQLARVLSEELRALGEAEARPLLRCVLAFQLEASGSSSAFHKLEQVCNTPPGRETQPKLP